LSFFLLRLRHLSKGLGVAIGKRRFVDEDLVRDTLVKLFDIEVSTGVSGHVTSATEASGRPKVLI